MNRISHPPGRLQRFLPFLAWIGELRNGRMLRADLVAGITVALVLVPQSMAYAQLAGLPAYYGLYAAFMPPMVAALFGSSRQLATGPVAVVSLLTAAALQPIAASGSPGYIAYAVMLSLMVGLFQFGLGLLRLGVLVNFLSHPVVIGFTNAAAIIIATSQLDKIFGVRAMKADHHYETVWNTVVATGQYIHWPTLAIAVLAFTTMIVLKRTNPRIPNVLIAVAATTLISYAIGFEKLTTIQIAQIGNESARQVAAERIKTGYELLALQTQLAAAEGRLATAIDQYGHDASHTLAVRHEVDRLRQSYERRMNTHKVDLEELRSVMFERVHSDATGEIFYLRGRVPEGLESDGHVWRVTHIDDDGRLHFSGGGRVVGAVPRGLPSFRLPAFDLDVILKLFAAAITISLIGFMEAISIAKSMAARTRQRLDPNQELIGQGVGNIVGSLFQSYPTSGSFSRSAVNISAGAVTGFASVVTGIIVVVTLLFLTPLLYHLPQATLAAVIMMAVIGLVNVASVYHAWKAQRQDGIVAVVTFFLTLAFAPHLDKGIMIGAGLALILYLYRTMQPRVAVLARHSDGTLRDAEMFGLETCKQISMIRFDGTLYFANVSYFEDKVLERVSAKPELKYVIVVGDGINQIDASGEEVVASLVQRLEENGVLMLFSGLKKQVLDVFGRTGLGDKLGPNRFFRTEDQALEYAWNQLGDNHEADCPLNVVCPVQPVK
ncbi:MAG TPA: SulP family inorganic anion transporter [Acidiferrobacterales bacterium]